MVRKLGLVALLALCVASAVAPEPYARHAYEVGSIALMVIALVAMARRTRHGRAPWLLIGGAMVIRVGLDTVPFFIPWGGQVWLFTYVMFAAGVVLMVRMRAPGQTRAGLLDGLTITAAAGVFCYQMFVRPMISDDWTTVDVVMSVGYWVGDLLQLAAVLFLVLSPGRRGAPTRLLVCGFGFSFLTNIGYVIAERFLAEGSLEWTLGLSLFTYALVVLAIAHPGRDELMTPVHTAGEPLHPARIAFLGLALVTAPLLAVTRSGLSADERIPLIVGIVITVGFSLARFTGAVRAQNRAQELLAHHADHDMLTGLANRRAFNAHLDLGVPANRDLTLLYLDLDHFKPINDEHGHAAGDAVLVEVANRLRGSVRAGDLVARLGGDEFAILSYGLDDEGLTALADRLVRLLSEPIEFEGMRLEVGASIGVATTADGDGDPEELVLRADRAMFGAKREGRGRAVVVA